MLYSAWFAYEKACLFLMTSIEQMQNLQVVNLFWLQRQSTLAALMVVTFRSNIFAFWMKREFMIHRIKNISNVCQLTPSNYLISFWAVA